MSERPAADGSPTWGEPGERPGAARARDQLGGPRRRPAAATTARAVQTWVDQSIAQAERQGAFDNLPGAGKPLRDVDTRTDPDWWVTSLIEREKLDLSDAMPGVMQLRREKSTFPESLLALPDEQAVRTRLEDFNERVLADRRRPYGGAGSPPVVGRVDVEEMLGVWRELRAARELASAQEEAERPDGASSAEPSTAAARRPSWWRRLQGPARRARS